MSFGNRWDQNKVSDRNGAGAKGQSSDGTGTSGNLAGFGGTDGKTLIDAGIAISSVGPTATRHAFLSYFLAGKPDAGATAYVPIPGNLASLQIPANFSGAKGACVNPTSTAVYTFYKNGSSFGTASISTGGVFTWSTSGGTAVSFTPGSDELSWSAPGTQDATLSDVRFAIPLTIS